MFHIIVHKQGHRSNDACVRNNVLRRKNIKCVKNVVHTFVRDLYLISKTKFSSGRSPGLF